MSRAKIEKSVKTPAAEFMCLLGSISASLIGRIRTKISAFLLLPRNRHTARIYYYSQVKASQEKVRINERAKERRSRLTTMLRLTDVARFTAMITYEVILNE